MRTYPGQKQRKDTSLLDSFLCACAACIHVWLPLRQIYTCCPSEVSRSRYKISTFPFFSFSTGISPSVIMSFGYSSSVKRTHSTPIYWRAALLRSLFAVRSTCLCRFDRSHAKDVDCGVTHLIDYAQMTNAPVAVEMYGRFNATIS